MRAFNPVAVQLARFESGNVNVPYMVSLLDNLDTGMLFGIRGLVEEAEVNRRGIFTE